MNESRPADPPGPLLGDQPLPGLIRRLRRLADVSQRELADRARLSAGAVSRLEAGTLTPSLRTLQRLLAVADLRLVVVDQEGRVVMPMQTWDNTLDGAGRRYPAHLDTILDPKGAEWWGARYGLAEPPETYHRDRSYRDARRRRSQWEVRVAKFRHDPPPPDPERFRPAPGADDRCDPESSPAS